MNVGGWKYIRSRPDKAMPIERGFLTIIEKAIGEDIKLDEIGLLFPDDPSAKQSLMQQQARQDQGQEVPTAPHMQALDQATD